MCIPVGGECQELVDPDDRGLQGPDRPGHHAVDIWNFHLYAPPWITDPTPVMDIGVRPFTQFVRTIEEGIYANCPLWCTEFGIGAWAGASNLHWSRIYMNNICLTWERESEIDRWFWFLGPYEEQWEYTCLLNRDQQTLSQLGQHYRSPGTRVSQRCLANDGSAPTATRATGVC